MEDETSVVATCGVMVCFRGFVGSKTPSVVSRIYHTKNMNNADNRNLTTTRMLKKNIFFINQSKLGKVIHMCV